MAPKQEPATEVVALDSFIWNGRVAVSEGSRLSTRDEVVQARPELFVSVTATLEERQEARRKRIELSIAEAQASAERQAAERAGRERPRRLALAEQLEADAAKLQDKAAKLREAAS